MRRGASLLLMSISPTRLIDDATWCSRETTSRQRCCHKASAKTCVKGGGRGRTVTVSGFYFCGRVNKADGATARVVVLPGAIFSTTVRC